MTIPPSKAFSRHVRGLRVVMFAAVVFLVGSVSFPGKAEAWSRLGTWTTGTGLFTVSLEINCDSFGQFGLACSDVQNAVGMATVPWNTTGGVNARFAYPSQGTDTTPPSNTILFRMITEFADPNRSMGTYMTSVGSTFVSGLAEVYSNWDWQFGHPITVSALDFDGPMIHELGHGLGLGHTGDTTTCGYNGNTTAPSVMVGNSSYANAHQIFLDDRTGLLGGTCGPYIQFVPTGALHADYSSNDGSTWTNWLTWSSNTTMTPAIAWGNPASTSIWVQAKVDTLSNNLVTPWLRDSSWHGPNTGNMKNAMDGVSAAYGNGKFLLAYPQLVSGNEAQIRVHTSTDGINWSTGTLLSWYTGHTVGLDYDAYTGYYYMAFGAIPNPNTSVSSWDDAGRVTVLRSTDGVTWTQTTWSPLPEWGQGGVGIGCGYAPNSMGDRCWIVWAAERYAQTTIRVQEFSTSSGDLSTPLGSFEFPEDGSRYVASRFGVQATANINTSNHPYLVIGFREGDGSASGDVLSWKVGDAEPPTGGDTYPVASNFYQSATPPRTGVLAGIGVTTDSTGVVYTLMPTSP